jgi:short subunit dehydrogenase-like uncharacterized protein
MIYGAYGFTGKLLMRRALEAGKRPVLAGRSAEKLWPLARQYGLEYRTASVDDRGQLARALTGISVMLNAAGPFSQTASAMLEACLVSGTHYLDVSGEIGAFEELYRYDQAAKQRGILVLPGAGFLVMATDCLAAQLARKLAAPTSLRIAISRPAFLAPGSRRTIVELIADHVRLRRDGVLVNVPVGALVRKFDLGEGLVSCAAISGAEALVTFLTTRIPNIEVYAPTNTRELALYRLGATFAGFLKLPPAQLAMKALANHWPERSNRVPRDQVVVAVVEDSSGKSVARRLLTRDPYETTARMALCAVERVLRGLPQTGFCTPAQICGPDLLFSLPGVLLEALSRPAA